MSAVIFCKDCASFLPVTNPEDVARAGQKYARCAKAKLAVVDTTYLVTGTPETIPTLEHFNFCSCERKANGTCGIEAKRFAPAPLAAATTEP